MNKDEGGKEEHWGWQQFSCPGRNNDLSWVMVLWQWREKEWWQSDRKVDNVRYPAIICQQWFQTIFRKIHPDVLAAETFIWHSKEKWLSTIFKTEFDNHCHEILIFADSIFSYCSCWKSLHQLKPYSHITGYLKGPSVVCLIVEVFSFLFSSISATSLICKVKKPKENYLPHFPKHTPSDNNSPVFVFFFLFS